MYETYHDFSIRHLLNLAGEFHSNVRAILGSPDFDYARHALPANSRVVISADRTGVRYNFSSRAAIDLILGEAEEMQTVADEARTRLSGIAGASCEIHELVEMERDVRKCLDIHYARPNPGLADLLAMGRP